MQNPACDRFSRWVSWRRQLGDWLAAIARLTWRRLWASTAHPAQRSLPASPWSRQPSKSESTLFERVWVPESAAASHVPSGGLRASGGVFRKSLA